MADPVDGTSNSSIAAWAESLSKLKASSAHNEDERKTMLKAAQKAVREFETPIETVVRIGWAEITAFVCLRVALKLNLFECLEENNGSLKSCAQLGEKTGADPALLARLLRHLAAMGHVHEAGVDQYGPNRFTKAMIDPVIHGGIPFCFDASLPSLLRLPEQLEKTQYRNPENPTAGPFQLGHDIDTDLFGWLKTHPDTALHFHNHMAGYTLDKPFWTDVYPVEERLNQGFDDSESDGVLLVDIGGSKGHDMQRFVQDFPNAKGRKIVQDLEHVIKEAEGLDKSIEMLEQDFFTPQKVQGARAYYFHSVLHDWGYEDSLRILVALKPALKRGYSKVLINDYVVPDAGANYVNTGLDMMVMVLLSAAERTEQQWRRLLGDAGLKVTGVFTSKTGEGQSVVEAELA